MAAQIINSPDVLSIENALVHLAFDPKNNYRLNSIRNKKTNCELIRDTEESSLLFYLNLKQDDPRFDLSFTSKQAGSLSAAGTGDAICITAVDFPGMPELVVHVTVRLDETALSKWTLAMDTPAGWHVYSLTCPIVTGVFIPGQAASGECLVCPCLGEGYLFHDPYPMVDGLTVKTGTGPDRLMEGMGGISQMSPGGASLQMMLYYNDLSGLYMAAHDGLGDVKLFNVGPDKEFGGNPSLSVTHMPQRGSGIAYETVVGVFEGDWYDGTDIYKAWARKQFWSKTLLKDRPMPEWMKKGFAVFQMGNYGLPKLDHWNTMDQIAETVNSVAEKAGVPMAGLVFNYEHDGGWTGPVGIFPPREGNEAFSASMRKMAEKGNIGFVYIPFGMWYGNIPYSEPFNSMKELFDEASHYAIRNKYGDVRVNHWAGYGWDSANLCPAGDGLHDLTLDIVNGLADLDCKIIQFDNWPICAAVECYGDKHGHPQGYGRWWTEEYIRIMDSINEKTRERDPEIAITTECITEQFLQTMHFFDQRAGNQEYFGHWIKGMPAGAELIPLFNYVYNPVTGSYLAAYPECAMPETTYWNRSVAKSVCQGVIPASGLYYGKLTTINETCLKYFEKVAGITVKLLWDYIMYAEMLRAPETDAPTVKMPYFTLNDPNTNALEYNRKLDLEFAYNTAVETAAFRLSDGRTAFIFMNITEKSVPIDAKLFIDKEANVRQASLDQYRDGIKARTITCDLPGRISLELKPLEVVIYLTRL